ncbi:hypothetical protein IWW34DRAFT_638032 [Fusarium oxysporum f. sp. albedinis]|uniref:Uncharacterized protein n=1 Tax=Fusarium oxysporum (strain Fo5176) TaxID=660025 RepID=F9F3G9_FUSOF|nr:hypothetical protein FOXB_00944 [Fusarium oxysporum f. sp. conglutinans Fo5176]KAI3572213.1 hypothetical protein IWW34DRAFT_638032 [Fusarium oxysporum f. sp. albedinis]
MTNLLRLCHAFVTDMERQGMAGFNIVAKRIVQNDAALDLQETENETYSVKTDLDLVANASGYANEMTDKIKARVILEAGYYTVRSLSFLNIPGRPVMSYCIMEASCTVTYHL